jgi:outer membrane protein TolC
LLASKRSYYLPEISAQADISAISRTGAGSTLQLGALPPGLSIPTPGNVNWNLSVQVSLPLFTSGARKAEVRKSELDLANSRTQRSATEQKIDQRTRSALHLAGASYAGIALTRDAANAARNNLELVRDAYSQGLANTITLLDAQNVALQADLAAANAIYEFLLDLMQVERSIGRFDFFLNREQVNDLLIRLDAYFSEQGYRVAR